VADVRSALAFLLVPLALIAPESAALAEEKIDAADGVAGCREFDEKNERELAEWSKTQPATPYAYAREDNILGAPWGPLAKGFGSTAGLLAATLIPHFGAQLRAETPAAVVSWPLQLPLGPAWTCTRHQGSFTVRTHKAHRVLLEPGIVSSNRGVGFFVRPGYRFLYQPSDWVVGVGGGVGTNIEISGNREPTRFGVGPEAVLRFGHCCDSGYFTLAARYDHFFGGNVTDIFWGSLGFVYF
jgi:hypothetical protein